MQQGKKKKQKKTWQTPWIDSFCFTRLSSASQFALSVSLQYSSILIEAMDPIFTFFFSYYIYSPAAVYETGFLINPASWESDCHLPVMKINVACLIWRETGILQPLAYTGCVQLSRAIWISECRHTMQICSRFLGECDFFFFFIKTNWICCQMRAISYIYIYI